MKVLWLSHNVPFPPTSGVLQRNYHLVRETASRTELHLVALRQRALCPDDAALRAARDELESYCASVRVFDLDWEVSVGSRTRLAARLFAEEPYDVVRYSSRPFRAFLAAGEAPDVDVVHFDTLGLTPYRPALPTRPSILNHHNIESHMLARRASGETNPFRRALYRWQAKKTREWERRHITQFACNTVVSEADAERLEEVRPGVRTAVIANGTDTSFFSTPANDEPGNLEVVMVGRHSWYPNRDAAEFFLDDIWPLIVEREPRATWTIVGKNPLPRVVAAAEADDRIRVLGFVDDLRETVRAAAVFVCPYRDGGGTRLKVLDALAMRKAMVSTSIGAEGLPLEPGRHYLLADTALHFADAVIELFRSPERRRELGEAGREFVEAHYDWSGIGARLYDVYERAVAASRRQ
ncbi:MAG: glycosyltransferase family 4 protein [Gemmatimonadota bacterium]|nr:glycosyltransferase family 4 protein [Gemmatimonadota bacterium]